MLKEQPEFIIAQDLSFKGILNDVKKSNTSLSPIFEAFTNALEAIKIKEKSNTGSKKGEIVISIYVEELTDKSFEFREIHISDTGIGFNEKEFKRFNTFKDNSKGYKNLGSGRIQYVHYFDRTVFRSEFIEEGLFYEREFVMSKSKPFLDKNAIVKIKYCKHSSGKETNTKITFSGLLEKSNIYNGMTDQTLKDDLIKRYLYYFCFNSEDLPKITIDYFVGNKLNSTAGISKLDIPLFDKRENISIQYNRVSKNAKSIEKIDKKEEFVLTTYRISSNILDSNDLKLISKGEVVEETKINLTGISKSDLIHGNKYLVLVSGNYIDERDSNVRGELNIPTRHSNDVLNLFNNEVIFIEDIEENVNSKLVSLYPEIEIVINRHKKELENIKEMFLIGDENDAEISLNDDDKKIIEKFYEAQAKKEARIDASLKQSIDRLENLDTTSKTYERDLEQEINRIVKIIPEQNKRTLSHYVARRKLVLELFGKIRNKGLKIQSESKRNKDEALIHNLLFHQKSTDSYGSDLWIINEEFIYFQGHSEFKLKDLKIENKKVFRTEFGEEEERYLNSLDKKRLESRPDVLLFPEEEKCIIIEFKAPNVDASDHLTQINKYATLIRNYTTSDFDIKLFYGYLIGEAIEPNDVMSGVTTFEYSKNFDYLFSPSQKVRHFNGGENGSIYTEVLKYSSLLQRAELRNNIFIKKLGL